MELGSQNGLTLALIQQILLGTCCVPSVLLISGKQAKDVWFFPHGWWGKTKHVHSPVCLISKSVCVHVRVCTFLPCQLATLLLRIIWLWSLLAQCQFCFPFRHHSAGASHRT